MPETAPPVTRPRHPGPFAVKDCALVMLATGRKARQLQEFRRELAEVDAASIYHHFWGGLLQTRFEEREYNNDFANWVWHGVHDAVLAERLSALAPTDFTDLEALRHAILELVDLRLDEDEYLSWMRATRPFEFVRSQIVVFNTQRQLQRPEDLVSAIGQFSASSIFYHFIDARRRTASSHDDFSDWLTAFGDTVSPVRERLAGIDPWFGSLGELRSELTQVFAACFRETTS